MSPQGAASLVPIPGVAEDAAINDFRRLAEASPAMVWLADPTAACTYVNAAWLEFRGATLDEELGDGWIRAIHPADLGRCQRQVRLAFRTQTILRLGYRIRTADGSYCEVEDIGHPWYDQNKRFRGYTGYVRIPGQYQSANAEAVQQLLSLSAREREVVELVARGYATKQLAAHLGISYKTADSHRSHVLKKLGIHETASLVRFAVRAGVIPE